MKTLTDILTEHESGPNVDHEECACGKWSDWSSDHPTHAAHVAAAYREARTVTTLAEADALPAGTVIRTENGAVVTLGGGGTVRQAGHLPYWKAQVGGKSLPAFVLWLPEEAS